MSTEKPTPTHGIDTAAIARTLRAMTSDEEFVEGYHDKERTKRIYARAQEWATAIEDGRITVEEMLAVFTALSLRIAVENEDALEAFQKRQSLEQEAEKAFPSGPFSDLLREFFGVKKETT